MAQVLRTQPDKTQVYRDDQSLSRSEQVPPQPPLSRVAMVDDLTACQFALASVLSPIEFWSLDRAALLKEQVRERAPFRMGRIYIDFPDPEDSQDPEAPTATIHQIGEGKLEIGWLGGTQLLEETQDLWAPGTILRKFGEVELELGCDFLTGDKDDRAALRRGVMEAFCGDPTDDSGGRKVVVPRYYDRVVQLDLKSVSYAGEDPEKGRARNYMLACTFTAHVELVSLVRTPGLLLPNMQLQTE